MNNLKLTKLPDNFLVYQGDYEVKVNYMIDSLESFKPYKELCDIVTKWAKENDLHILNECTFVAGRLAHWKLLADI